MHVKASLALASATLVLLAAFAPIARRGIPLACQRRPASEFSKRPNKGGHGCDPRFQV